MISIALLCSIRAINGRFKRYYKLSHHKFRLIGEIHERKEEREGEKTGYEVDF